MHTCWISICIRFCRHHWGQDAVTTGGLGSTFAVGLAAGASAAAIIAGACATSIVHHRLNFQKKNDSRAFMSSLKVQEAPVPIT